MDYILQPQLLNLSNNNLQCAQYYVWSERERRKKLGQQEKQLQQMWLRINEEEEEERVKKQNSIKAIAHNEDFYAKKQQWKNQKENKLAQLRNKKLIQQEEKDKLSQIPIKKSRHRFQLGERYEPKHKGPINAWQERFEEYLKARDANYSQQHIPSFHPKINEKSKKLTHTMVGKPQDRLLEYGERLKVKKSEMQLQIEKQYCRKPNSQSITNNPSNVFSRLYKEGEQMNKAKTNTIAQFSFKPTINSYSPSTQQRIANKRKPLYFLKQSVTINKSLFNNFQQNDQKKVTSHHNAKTFDNFLKRNEMLLQKINKNRSLKERQQKEKAKKQDRECTFTPVINQHSSRLFQLKQIQQLKASQNNYHQMNQNYKEPQNIYQNMEHLQIEIVERDEGLFSVKTDRILNQPKDKLSISFSDVQIRVPRSIALLGNFAQSILKTDQILQLTPEQVQQIQTITNSKKQSKQFEDNQDSIQKQKQKVWQAQLQTIEAQIQQMMARTKTNK